MNREYKPLFPITNIVRVGDDILLLALFYHFRDGKSAYSLLVLAIRLEERDTLLSPLSLTICEKR